MRGSRAGFPDGKRGDVFFQAYSLEQALFQAPVGEEPASFPTAEAALCHDRGYRVFRGAALLCGKAGLFRSRRIFLLPERKFLHHSGERSGKNKKEFVFILADRISHYDISFRLLRFFYKEPEPVRTDGIVAVHKGSTLS